MKAGLVDPLERKRLAAALRVARKIERVHAVHGEYFKKRSRQLPQYQFYLGGLDATLSYVNGLPVKKVVDLGTGRGRALLELQVAWGEKLSFVGTGLLWERTIVYPHYRLTPAELMRGFALASVGCFISVFGPFHYSSRLDLVAQNIDDRLLPGGLVKLALTMWESNNEQKRNDQLKAINFYIENFFRDRGYGVALQEIPREEADWTGLALLAIKPSPNLFDPGRIARSLIAEDYQNAPRVLVRQTP